MTTFVAIDFETANHDRDSACAIGLTRVTDGRIVSSDAYLIRPPSPSFVFTHIHNLTWDDVRDERTFGELWPTLAASVAGADYLVAHNAAFDNGVLRACCASFGIDPPKKPFFCTVRLARDRWGIRPTKLPDVCGHLRIPLNHHDPRSDSEACARIVVAALDGGWAPELG